jgi:dihydrofolate reductase
MTVTIMAAVARNGVIGYDGGIPWHLPDDMRRFRELTMGHVLVMGRRTYESIGRPLPGRTTIVVTRRGDWRPDHEAATLRVAPDLRAALRQAAGLGAETFIQGGAAVYAEALTIADRMLITWVDADPPGDTFFPEVDWSQWEQSVDEAFPGGHWATYLRRQNGAGKAE